MANTGHRTWQQPCLEKENLNRRENRGGGGRSFKNENVKSALTTAETASGSKEWKRAKGLSSEDPDVPQNSTRGGEHREKKTRRTIRRRKELTNDCEKERKDANIAMGKR